METGWQ